MSIFSSDLDAMFADPLFGSRVRFGTFETSGIVSLEEHAQDDGAGFSTPVWMTVLLVRDGTLPSSCTVDSEIEVDGLTYVVRNRLRVDDGGARAYHIVQRTD